MHTKQNQGKEEDAQKPKKRGRPKKVIDDKQDIKQPEEEKAIAVLSDAEKSKESSPEPKQPNRPKRGILMLALGSSEYGKMAANAAASIRVKDDEIPIHLVFTAGAINHLTPAHRSLFTSTSECPPEYYTKNGKVVYIKAKTCIYELSPFEETLFLDVDLLIFTRKKISALIDELSAKTDFTMQNRGYCDMSKPMDASYCLWVNPNEVKTAYGIEDGRFYLLASELIFFKRNADNAAFFESVREIYDNPKVTGMRFDQDLPDELAYNIASAVLKKYPHEDSKVFVYWFAADKKIPWSEVLDKYIGYSIGGNQMPPDAKRKYEQITRAQALALRLPYSFKIHPKKSWNPGRIAI